MTVPAAVPKEMLIELLAVAEDTDDGDEIAGGFVAAIKRLQHLEQLAESMTGAREALAKAAAEFHKKARHIEKGIGVNKGPLDNWKSEDVAFNTAKRDEFDGVANQLRSLIASLGETK
jgi:hypothetical protein